MSPHLRLRPSVLATLFAVPAALLMAACGSLSSSSTSSGVTPVSSPSPSPSTASTAAASATANFDSCNVVTQAEAASAIGGSVSSGVLGTATVEGGLACVLYGSAAPMPHTPNVAQSDTVRVVVVEGPDALTWYNDYKSTVSAQPISGYGDQAYYDGYASLSVMKGNYYLRVAVISPGIAPTSLSNEEKLAAAILPSL
jgi:hypothetical protein